MYDDYMPTLDTKDAEKYPRIRRSDPPAAENWPKNVA